MVGTAGSNRAAGQFSESSSLAGSSPCSAAQQQPRNVKSILRKRGRILEKSMSEETVVEQGPRRICKGTRSRDHPDFTEPEKTITHRRIILIDMKNRIRNRDPETIATLTESFHLFFGLNNYLVKLKELYAFIDSYSTPYDRRSSDCLERLSDMSIPITNNSIYSEAIDKPNEKRLIDLFEVEVFALAFVSLARSLRKRQTSYACKHENCETFTPRKTPLSLC